MILMGLGDEATLAKLNNHPRNVESTMRVLVLFIVAQLIAGAETLADEVPLSLSSCLPTTSEHKFDPDTCSLVHRLPPPLKQDIKVTDCYFLPGYIHTGAFALMKCSVSNNSSEAVESIKYAICYMVDGEEKPLLEAGSLHGPIGFSTANILGNLQPGETRILGFAGEGLPEGTDARSITSMIEVLGVRVPDSFALR